MNTQLFSMLVCSCRCRLAIRCCDSLKTHHCTGLSGVKEFWTRSVLRLNKNWAIHRDKGSDELTLCARLFQKLWWFCLPDWKRHSSAFPTKMTGTLSLLQFGAEQTPSSRAT